VISVCAKRIHEILTKTTRHCVGLLLYYFSAKKPDINASGGGKKYKLFFSDSEFDANMYFNIVYPNYSAIAKFLMCYDGSDVSKRERNG
jgi:hypothetical protein